jgi:hypothetical protein
LRRTLLWAGQGGRSRATRFPTAPVPFNAGERVTLEDLPCQTPSVARHSPEGLALQTGIRAGRPGDPIWRACDTVDLGE